MTGMIHAVVMAGGKGLRFWPLSRSGYPKQFLSVLEEKPLLQLTVERLAPLFAETEIWITGNAEHTALLKTLCPNNRLLVEPVGRNTAATVAFAALEIAKIDPDGIMVILPSDHFVNPQDAFQRDLHHAAQAANTHKGLAIIGIPPQTPHTGYGYIQVDTEVEQDVFSIRSFVEKPDLTTAQHYLKTGGFFWNAGILAGNVSVIIELFEQLLPDILISLRQFIALPQEAILERKTLFASLPALSVDYGILEHAANRTYLTPAHFEWDDIGSWSVMKRFWSQDDSKNAVKGTLFPLNSHSNIVYSPNKPVALVGVENLVIVETEDVLLVMAADQDQNLKALFPQLPDTLTQ